MRVLALVCLFAATAAQSQSLGGSSFNQGGSSDQQPVLGDWICDASSEFGTIIGAVTYFPGGYSAGSFVLELSDPVLSASVFATSRWSLQDEVLSDTLTRAAVLSLEIANLTTTPEMIAEFERSLVSGGATQSRVLTLTSQSLELEDVVTGDRTSCARP